jgi:hypothetical protein
MRHTVPGLIRRSERYISSQVRVSCVGLPRSHRGLGCLVSILPARGAGVGCAVAGACGAPHPGPRGRASPRQPP